MSIETDHHDYHDVIRGAMPVTPDELFATFVNVINRSVFLKIIEGNESKLTLKVVSKRESDPRELIEIKVRMMSRSSDTVFGSYYSIRVNDEQYLKDIQEGKRSIAPRDKDTFAYEILSPFQKLQFGEPMHDSFGLFKP